MNRTLLHGHCIDKLNELPAKSVHCIVTSPPYYRLRHYKTPPQIWGESGQCEHDWIEHVSAKTSGSKEGSTLDHVSEGTQNAQATRDNIVSWTCKHCRAYKGELGWEPTPDLFVNHVVEVMAACWRVLRDDGNLWLNIADSFAASGHGHGGGSRSEEYNHAELTGGYQGRKPPACWNLKKKDMMLIPHRLGGVSGLAEAAHCATVSEAGMKPTIGTVCSGIGGIDLGFENAGFECKFVVELDANCQNVLRRHFPGAQLLSDMKEAGANNLPHVSVLAGGTPCQGFSIAGLRGSMEDDRSNLCLQFCRIANELEPSIIVWENVVGVLSTKDNAFGCFLAALVGADAPLVPPRAIDRWKRDDEGREYFSWPNAGVVVGPRRTAAFRVLDSQYFGVAQRRERVFVVADSLGGCSPQILFESEGVRRHSPPCRETGQRVTGTISARTEGGGGLGTDFELGVGGLVPTSLNLSEPSAEALSEKTDTPSSRPWPAEITPTLNAAFADKQGLEDQHALNGGDCSCPEVAWALQERDAKGPDSSTKEGHLIVTGAGGFFDEKNPTAVVFKPSHFTRGKDGAPSEVMPPLSADADKGAQEPVVAIRLAQTSSNGCGIDESGKAYTLDGTQGQAVAFQQHQVGEVMGTLGTNSNPSGRNTPMISAPTMVRRLTPTECARLQAHPDDWSAWGLDAAGKRVEQSDSSQYRQYGNGVTATVLTWIARRTLKFLTP